MNDKVVFICYDIKLRDYFTSCNIEWLVTGLNQNNMKSFWVYDNRDLKVISIIEKWKRKELF